MTLEIQRETGATLSLRPRQIEILSLAASGLNQGQIARELGIAIRTVTTHITHVHKIMGVKSTSRAVLDAVNLGILNLGELTEGLNLESVKSLSPAEARVAEAMIQSGVPNSNSDLARRLFLGVATVETHKIRLVEKTGARSRIQCCLILLAAKRQGLIPTWE